MLRLGLWVNTVTEREGEKRPIIATACPVDVITAELMQIYSEFICLSLVLRRILFSGTQMEKTGIFTTIPLSFSFQGPSPITVDTSAG